MLVITQGVDASAPIAIPAEAIDCSFTAHLKNVGTDTVYVGNSDVDPHYAESGYPVEAGESLTIHAKHEKLYVVCDAGDSTQIRVLIIKD